MASASLFAAAFEVPSPIDSSRSYIYECSKKRKRTPVPSKNGANRQEPTGPLNLPLPIPNIVLSRSGNHTSATLERGRLAQDKIPSQSNDDDDDLARGKFPHGIPNIVETASHGRAKSKPNISDTYGAAGLRQRHLMALGAITHKCLLEGDYGRASRAWGLLLRAEHSSHSIDLRTSDRWAIGSEILLQREAYLVKNREQTGEMLDQYTEYKQQHQISDDVYSTPGFEQAKDYYERLILQYPYRKAFPSHPGPQDFYMAMFSLWIYAVEEHQCISLSDTERSIVHAGQVEASKANKSRHALISDLELHKHQQNEEIRQNTLRRAQEISARLHDLLSSPPYSDNAKFRELRGMMDLWVGDLSLITSSHQNRGSDTGDEISSLMGECSNMSTNLDTDKALAGVRTSR